MLVGKEGEEPDMLEWEYVPAARITAACATGCLNPQVAPYQHRSLWKWRHTGTLFEMALS